MFYEPSRQRINGIFRNGLLHAKPKADFIEICELGKCKTAIRKYKMQIIKNSPSIFFFYFDLFKVKILNN